MRKIIFGILIVVLLVAGCTSSKEYKSSGSGSQEIKAVIYDFSESVEVGEFQYVFKSVNFENSVGIGGYSNYKEADGVFMVVWVEVENIGKKSKRFDMGDFSFLDEEERIFNVDRIATFNNDKLLEQTYSDFDSLSSVVSIGPGLKKEGFLVFDVVSKDTTGKIKIFDGKNTVFVNLEK